MKIMIVDDEKMIRKIVRAFLEIEGYEVVDASSIEEVKERIEKIEKIEKIDVAIVDGSLTSGGLTADDGEEVAKILREKIPGIKIVALSGLKVAFGDVNLEKPVKVEKLLEAVKV